MPKTVVIFMLVVKSAASFIDTVKSVKRSSIMNEQRQINNTPSCNTKFHNRAFHHRQMNNFSNSAHNENLTYNENFQLIYLI